LGTGLLCLGALALGAHAKDASELIQLQLVPTTYNAGKIGTAVITPSREQTGVNITVSGVPDYTARPVHLYTYLIEGSCQSQASAVPLKGSPLAESLLSPGSIGAYRGPVRLSYRVPRPFEEFSTRRFAISVRLGPADGGREIFCGEKVG
jgi:hypothetical protein